MDRSHLAKYFPDDLNRRIFCCDDENDATEASLRVSALPGSLDRTRLSENNGANLFDVVSSKSTKYLQCGETHEWRAITTFS